MLTFFWSFLGLDTFVFPTEDDLFRTNHDIDPLVNGIDVWMVRPIRH
jgi:hypothetical protein